MPGQSANWPSCSGSGDWPTGQGRHDTLLLSYVVAWAAVVDGWLDLARLVAPNAGAKSPYDELASAIGAPRPAVLHYSLITRIGFPWDVSVVMQSCAGNSTCS